MLLGQARAPPSQEEQPGGQHPIPIYGANDGAYAKCLPRHKGFQTGLPQGALDEG
jgi:hypothetical protein